jgi:hypothetical protein
MVGSGGSRAVLAASAHRGDRIFNVILVKAGRI